VAGSSFRLYSTRSSYAGSKPSQQVPNKQALTLEERKKKDDLFRKRKTEWKRRQGVRHDTGTYTGREFLPDSQGETFLDHLIVHIRAGM